MTKCIGEELIPIEYLSGGINIQGRRFFARSERETRSQYNADLLLG